MDAKDLVELRQRVSKTIELARLAKSRSMLVRAESVEARILAESARAARQRGGSKLVVFAATGA